jgi:hypothetical protein
MTLYTMYTKTAFLTHDLKRVSKVIFKVINGKVMHDLLWVFNGNAVSIGRILRDRPGLYLRVYHNIIWTFKFAAIFEIFNQSEPHIVIQLRLYPIHVPAKFS